MIFYSVFFSIVTQFFYFIFYVLSIIFVPQDKLYAPF